MPLYSDSNYYYSGGSSQLFSPYYPTSLGTSSPSSIYSSPYTSTYNRAISGSYVVPLSTSRSPSYSLASSSRYQPKLSTITESSPLISAARHSTLMPLTRINSPKYTSYSSTTPVHLPKYIPPKPILINTADIDVSANRYRRRKEEALRQAQLEHEAEMAARLHKGPEREAEIKNENNSDEERAQMTQKHPDTSNSNNNSKNLDEEPPRRNRSTIKRNRAVVRLSTIRSRSKERNRIKVEDLYSPEPEEKKFKDPSVDRESLAAEVSPRDDNKDILLNKETLQEVVLELDPKYHTVRRLSIPQCPTFHDICEDISSDKIDDDLNAGELRRRQSVIQIQEQQLLNQLQKSPSGTFQMINLERRDSHDSTDSQQSTKRHSKRLSKKGNRIRHKITAIVEVENVPSSLSAQLNESSLIDPEKSPLPKFTVNVDSVEEHHEINKVFKLPKKKNVKKVTKSKDEPLPEGFMSAIARPQPSPKKKMLEKKDTFKTTAEIFTFDEKAVEECNKEDKVLTNDSMKRSQSEEAKSPSTPSKMKEPLKEEPKTPTKVIKTSNKVEEKCFTPKLIKPVEIKAEEVKLPTKALEDINREEKCSGITTPVDSIKRSQSEELKSPKTPSKIKEALKEKPSTPTKVLKTHAVVEEKFSAPKLIKPVEMKAVEERLQAKMHEIPSTPKASTITESKEFPFKEEEISNSPKTCEATKTAGPLEKSNYITVELKTPKSNVKTMTTNKDESVKVKDETNIKLSPIVESTVAPKSLKSSDDKIDSFKESLIKGDKNDEIKSPTKTLTSPTLDVVGKPSLVKPLGKTNSITMELKSTATPTKLVQSPIKDSISEELPVATPKPIRKCIKRSESGEDFWAQIGSRETLYMNKRKQEILECQWKKRENLLEFTTNEDVSNLDDIKTTVKQQKEQALKKADNEGLTSHSANIGRSSSNESALNKETVNIKHIKEEEKKTEILNKINSKAEETNTELVNKIKEVEKTDSLNNVKEAEKSKVLLKAKSEEEKDNKLKDEVKQVSLTKIKSEEKVDKKSSPIKKKITSPKPKPAADKTIGKSGEVESKETKFTDKLENSKTKISTPVTEANAKTSSATTTSTTTTTPTKITGQVAKSPEQQQQRQEQEEQNTKQTTQAKSNDNNNNSNKNELDINKTSAIATKTNDQPPPALLAKSLTSAKDNNNSGSNSKVTANTIAAAAATKQPETKATSVPLTAAEIKPASTAVASEIATAKPAKKLQADAKKTTTPTKVKIQTPPKAKAKLSPQSVINADQFVAKAPAKPNTSPVKQANLATTPLISSSPSKTTTTATTVAQSAPTTKKTPDAKKKTTNATSTSTDNISTTTAKAMPPTSATIKPPLSSGAATPTSTAASTTTTTGGGGIRNENAAFKCVGNVAAGSDIATTIINNSDSTGGGNLSKFATVSNLAQCLQDVDADLDDYIPTSAENSEDENYTDDSDFDYSSIDGWDKFTPSMKKKIKQRRRKEKQAEQARFDPQKKVKIDTTRKLYVKEEAPRYPLVATPRPLWKREKIVYPVEDSDESDSEESGSTEETEESDECTTSEEFEDELNPTASGGGATTSGGSGNSNSDPNIIRMSTCSNDSGFEGGTAPSSPKKMLECDVNCHKKCERLTANLCGVNQKLIVEALANVKRGARETRDSPSTPPSSNPAYKIEPNEEQDETSYTYSQFQKSGRFTPPATIIPRFKNYTVDDFHFLAVLGKGSFGKVLLAELRDTTYYYAVKCLKKDVVLEDDDVDSTLIERKVLALGTKHPYLCHLFCTFQTESHLFFVMEYLNGGDLMFHIQESGRFTEERARFYGAEIISGLKFLHKKGIIYRDLKLDNVLLDYEGHVRIADFGMCKLQIYLDKTADSFCGTPDYMAPEIIKGESYNQNVDWWSFGVLLYEMLIGQSPFSGCDEDELFWSICNEIPWFPVYISAEATHILKGLLEKDYTKRIGSQYSPAGDIVEHIFFRPIDWNLLEKRQIEPPFRPQVKHPLDTQYFDRVFTRERVRLTPIDKDILQSMDQKQFLGFTYTNPHITLDE